MRSAQNAGSSTVAAYTPLPSAERLWVNVFIGR